MVDGLQITQNFISWPIITQCMIWNSEGFFFFSFWNVLDNFSETYTQIILPQITPDSVLIISSFRILS